MTDRQLHILRMVAEGHTNDQIARRINRVRDTVENELKVIYAELLPPNTPATHHRRPMIVAEAFRRGLLT